MHTSVFLNYYSVQKCRKIEEREVYVQQRTATCMCPIIVANSGGNNSIKFSWLGIGKISQTKRNVF